MDKGDQDSQIPPVEFPLMGMRNVPNHQKNLFLLSIMTCPVTVVGNTFLMGLLLENLETCYRSTTLVVPWLGTALFLLTAMLVQCPSPFSCMECFLLVATSYNEYLLVCHPLLSITLLSWKCCLQKTAAPWLGGFLSSTAIILFLPQTHFEALTCWTTSS